MITYCISLWDLQSILQDTCKQARGLQFCSMPPWHKAHPEYKDRHKVDCGRRCARDTRRWTHIPWAEAALEAAGADSRPCWGLRECPGGTCSLRGGPERSRRRSCRTWSGGRRSGSCPGGTGPGWGSRNPHGTEIEAGVGRRILRGPRCGPRGRCRRPLWLAGCSGPCSAGLRCRGSAPGKGSGSGRRCRP